MTTKEIRAEAHKEITYIFEELLPKHGLTHRPEQVKLSHLMLDAMIDGKIALCDAGTGIGKTFSYLVAGTVFDHFRTRYKMPRQPLIVSTSSIALQTAVKYEYLPLLSATLLDAGVIDTPVLAVIRKGKSHYVCDSRLEQRLLQVNTSRKNIRAQEALENLQSQLDLDEAVNLSSYDRKFVHVPDYCDCDRRYCRYRDFIKQCSSQRYLFQVCNHNLLFADTMHRKSGKQPIFPEPCALVLDESHKVPEVAREMFGVTLCKEDVQAAIYGLRMERYVLAAEYLTDATKPLLEKMETPPERATFAEYVPLLRIPYQVLQTVNKKLCCQVTHLLKRNLQKLMTTMETLLQSESEDNMVCYAAEENGGTKLCATIYDLTWPMKKILWSKSQGIILTSGTAEKDRHYTDEVHLPLCPKHRRLSQLHSSPAGAGDRSDI